MSSTDHLMQLMANHQTDIAVSLDRKLAGLSASDQDKTQLLAQARWELVRVLREYQLFKHSRIYDPAIRSDIVLHARRAADLKARCIAAGEVYRAHVLKWSLSGGGSDWGEYERDLRGMVKGIKRHLAEEAHHIRTLLLSEGDR